jgi:hypothetical protein
MLLRLEANADICLPLYPSDEGKGIFSTRNPFKRSGSLYDKKIPQYTTLLIYVYYVETC